MADRMIFHKTGLTSGGAGCLDSISGANRGDTNPLQADDAAFVMVSSLLYAYLFDAASTATESSPDIIRPDDIAVGSPGRWILQSVNPTAAQIAAIITGATNETTPLDADDFGFYKATVAALRKVTWANIKATLKAYFDGIYATGTIPTKAAYTDINTGTDDAKFLTSLALTESKPNVHGQTITAIRGAELAPALTEANWDTNVAGWTHAVTGGILDKSGDGTGSVSMTTPISVTAGDRIEVIATVAVSPTTSTFVAGTIALNIGGISQAIKAVGSCTFIGEATTTAGFTVTNGNASRFGISAVSVKKLTEGNLTMDGGQIRAEADLVGGVPGYTFEGHTDTGLAYSGYGASIVVDGHLAINAYSGEIDFYDPADQTWLGGFYVSGTYGMGFWSENWAGGAQILSTSPTGGTYAGWKLGSVVNNEIEVEVGGDTVKRMLVTTTSLAAGTEQIRGTTKEIFKTADADSPLTAVECAGTIVSNYGMTDADCTIELPAAAEGLSFVCILPAVQAHFFKLHAGATDKIYLLGVAGSDNGNVGVASGYAAGASASFFTFKTGGTPDYDWFCIPIFGTWVAS
jgi:hypothetical protein